MALHDWADRNKPRASAATRVLLAALMWSMAGTLLAFFGVRWVIRSGVSGLLIVPAMVVGVLKAKLVLERSAVRAVARIREQGSGRCAGGFFSWKGWLFVILMAGLGRILRGGVVPVSVVGLVYVAVGSALLVASVRLWQGWVALRGTA